MPNQYSKDTKRKILEHLLYEDMSTIKLSKLLGIREFAIRRHLDFMEKEGLVAYAFKQIGMGRPKKIYSLTDKAKETFVKRYSMMATMLIGKVVERSGKEYAKTVLEDVSDEIAKHYGHRGNTLEEKVKAFTDFLTEFGCYASCSKENDTYEIIKRNCVFWDLARQYEDIVCEVDAQTTIKILGGNVTLIRAMCLAKGDKVCKYIIIPLQPEESKPQQ